MNGRWIRISGIFALFAILALAGCITPKRPDAPPFITSDAAEVPSDVQVAAAALINRMGGIDSTDIGVFFKAGLGEALENDFYRGPWFRTASHRLYQYAQRPDGKPGRLAAGQVILKDLLGRRMALDYMVEYDLSETGLVIEAAQAVPVFSTDPEVELYIVPAETVEAQKDNYPPNWEGLYLMARQFDLLQEGEKAQTEGSGKNIMLLFLMDRTAPSAKTTLRIVNHKTPDMYYGWDRDSKYLNFGGFRVAMASGSFPIAPKQDFWIKLVFSPGKEAPSRTQRIIYHQDLRKISAR